MSKQDRIQELINKKIKWSKIKTTLETKESKDAEYNKVLIEKGKAVMILVVKNDVFDFVKTSDENFALQPNALCGGFSGCYAYIESQCKKIDDSIEAINSTTQDDDYGTGSVK